MLWSRNFSQPSWVMLHDLVTLSLLSLSTENWSTACTNHLLLLNVWIGWPLHKYSILTGVLLLLLLYGGLWLLVNLVLAIKTSAILERVERLLVTAIWRSGLHTLSLWRSILIIILSISTLLLVLFFLASPVRFYDHVLIFRWRYLLLSHQLMTSSSIGCEISRTKLALLPVVKWLIGILRTDAGCYDYTSRESLHTRMMIIRCTQTTATENWTVLLLRLKLDGLLLEIWAGVDLFF